MKEETKCSDACHSFSLDCLNRVSPRILSFEKSLPVVFSTSVPPFS